jgi:hypothetical protein
LRGNSEGCEAGTYKPGFLLKTCLRLAFVASDVQCHVSF